MDYQTAWELANNTEKIKELRRQKHPWVHSLTRSVAGEICNGNLNLYNLNQDVERVIRLLPSSLEIRESQLKESPSDPIFYEFVSQEIAPWVKTLRQDIFGSTETPFKNEDKLNEWTDKQWAGMEDNPSYSYWRYSEDEGTIFFLVESGSPLERLIGECIRLEEETGLSASSLMRHILIGAKPYLHKLHIRTEDKLITLPSGNSIKRRWVTVTIKGDLKSREERALYSLIREELGMKRTKDVRNDKVLELYQLVTQKGGEPPKGRIKNFWESIRFEWNQKHPEDLYKEWRCPKRAYDRLILKLTGGVEPKRQNKKKTKRR